jgi:hypothetical protein
LTVESPQIIRIRRDDLGARFPCGHNDRSINNITRARYSTELTGRAGSVIVKFQNLAFDLEPPAPLEQLLVPEPVPSPPCRPSEPVSSMVGCPLRVGCPGLDHRDDVARVGDQSHVGAHGRALSAPDSLVAGSGAAATSWTQVQYGSQSATEIVNSAGSEVFACYFSDNNCMIMSTSVD